MLKSIFFKYFIITVILVCLCFTMLGAVLLVMTANYTIEQQQNQLLYAAQNLSTLTADMDLSPLQLYHELDGTYENDRYFNNYLNMLRIFSEGGERDIIIVGPSGSESLWFNTNEEVQYDRNLISYEALNQLKQTGSYKETGTFGDIFVEPRYTVGVPIIAEQATKTGNIVRYISGYMFVCSPAKTMTSLFSVIAQFYFIAVGVVLLISLLFVYIGTKSQARPLREIKNALESFSKGDFSSRVRVKGHDEAAQLCTSFNEMADTLESVENSRRAFMANVSHDLKTPMTSICGFIDGILDGTIPPESSKSYLQRVSKEINRLSRLVQSILDVSKLEGGQIEMNFSDLNISQIACQVMFAFERTIEEKQIEVELPVDADIMVRADEDSIYRILNNLIGNAVKFTPIGGTISIAVEKPSRTHAKILVRNTGIGIAKEEIPHLFERFYKSDKSRGLDKEGTGLGLYIAKILTVMNHGEISVSSVEGEYTEFSFTLELSHNKKK